MGHLNGLGNKSLYFLIFLSSLASRIAFMPLATRSSISGTAAVAASSLTGFGCLLDGLRVFILTGSVNGSTIGVATGRATILVVALAIVAALGLGNITSGGVFSLFRSSKDVSLDIFLFWT